VRDLWLASVTSVDEVAASRPLKNRPFGFSDESRESFSYESIFKEQDGEYIVRMAMIAKMGKITKKTCMLGCFGYTYLLSHLLTPLVSPEGFLSVRRSKPKKGCSSSAIPTLLE